MTSELPAATSGDGAVAVSPAERPRPRHMAELDGVRGVAILGVMLLHFVGSLSAQNILERVVVKLSIYGVWGVDLFFVLSGFLITGILYDAKGSARYFKNFYARRTLRIFPLYYAVLAVLVLLPVGAVAGVFGELAELQRVQGYLWPYLTNFYVASTGSFSVPYVSHFWSLAVEEHFYLFWPFVVGSLSLVATQRVSLLLMTLALGLRLFFSQDASSSVDAMKALVWTPCRLDALCCGAWFALAVRSPARAAVERACKRLVPILAAVIVALSAFHARTVAFDAWVLPLRGTALALWFGAAIVELTSDNGFAPAKRAARAGWLRWLGRYSYGLYVFHGIVAYLSHEHAWEARWTVATGSHALAAVLVSLVGIGLSVAISVASFELFEQPVLKLKRLFEYQPANASRERHAGEGAHGAKSV
jgi:peptidoglycan/LPS O-acetylase OafA/YrhL